MLSDEKYSPKKILRLIGDGKSRDVVALLFQMMEAVANLQGFQQVKEYYNQLALLSSRQKEISRQLNLGLLQPQEGLYENNKLEQALIEFVGKLPAVFWEPGKEKEAAPELPAIAEPPVVEGKPPREFKYDIFLCFSSEDLPAAKEVWEKLVGAGLRVFFSEESLKLESGISFFEKIENALLSSTSLVLLCSGHSVKSEWVKVEYQTFFNECYLADRNHRRFYILPLEQFRLSKLPLLLRTIQASRNIEDLIQALKRPPSKEETNAEKKARPEPTTKKEAPVKEEAAEKPARKKAPPKAKAAASKTGGQAGKPKPRRKEAAKPQKQNSEQAYRQAVEALVKQYRPRFSHEYFKFPPLPEESLSNLKRIVGKFGHAADEQELLFFIDELMLFKKVGMILTYDHLYLRDMFRNRRDIAVSDLKTVDYEYPDIRFNGELFYSLANLTDFSTPLVEFFRELIQLSSPDEK